MPHKPTPTQRSFLRAMSDGHGLVVRRFSHSRTVRTLLEMGWAEARFHSPGQDALYITKQGIAELRAYDAATSRVQAEPDPPPQNSPPPEHPRRPAAPTLIHAAGSLAAVLGAILKMSDEACRDGATQDGNSRLLRMQNSIQKNAHRIRPYIAVVLQATRSDPASTTKSPTETVNDRK